MPSVSKKSLADQLAALHDVAPVDIDPENAENYTSYSSDSSNEGSDDGRGHYETVGKSKLRADTMEGTLAAAIYKGQKSSRRDIYSEDDESKGSIAESAASDDSDMNADLEDEASTNVSTSAASVDEEPISDAETSSSNTKSSNDNDDSDDVQRLLAADQKAIVQNVLQTAQEDIEKGKAVKTQLTAFDSLLDARIKLQKGLQAINSAVVDKTVIDEATAGNIERSALSLLEKLLSLQESMILQDIPAAQIRRKRKLDDAELQSTEEVKEEITSLARACDNWRDQTLTKWSKKVQSANTLDRGKKFKVLDQSILAQIKESKSDRDRLLKRTQVKRFKSTNGAVTAEDRDPEIFDDGDFYQQMLKDLIDTRVLASNGNQVRTLATKQPKQKKGEVDTRASKGRKLRYHVHEKLQNFMAPMPVGTWHEEQINELFGSLLGQSIAVDELDPVAPPRAITADQGFKLFG